ncbi:unnamed protein product [Clavelina lepadiformis]|uniref:Uncharacterized protein n=1 Tax=Clavelina lepadiformis TaxID=159417 RepID=A0ABP0GSM8_CLALP
MTVRGAGDPSPAAPMLMGHIPLSFQPTMHKDDSRSVDELYATKPFLQPDDVVNAVLFAITSPSHVEINDMRIRPTGQLN